tara:strand:- start:190 stop:498 length:309 start_codon:yes stop_codon:yes gene_type:complete
MTQSINKPTFKANEAAKQVEQLKKSFDAPAVKTVKQGLVPAPKAAKTPVKTSPVKKSGRVVGISADENKMLQNLLQTVQEDPNYSIISSTEAFAKLQGRYNK